MVYSFGKGNSSSTFSVGETHQTFLLLGPENGVQADLPSSTHCINSRFLFSWKLLQVASNPQIYRHIPGRSLYQTSSATSGRLQIFCAKTRLSLIILENFYSSPMFYQTRTSAQRRWGRSMTPTWCAQSVVSDLRPFRVSLVYVGVCDRLIQ